MINICLKFKHLLENGLLAPRCTLCLCPIPAKQSLCTGCLKQLPWRVQHYCHQCGLACHDRRCGQCLMRPPYFEQTIAAFDYAYPIDRCISHFKYQHQLHLAQPLAHSLIQALSQQMTLLPDVCVAMPLHPKRMAERGFNQSLELAKQLSQHFPLAISHACERVIDTPRQVGLPQSKRIRNVRGAFRCDRSLAGKRVAIVDDVMTTGASLNELAKQIKKSGAAHVQCWLIARTQPHA